MKITREKSQNNRAQVIEAAGKLFRERGLDGVGLAGIMKEAGLTVGGFYRNFGSKDHLAAEASGHAASSMKAAMMAELAHSPQDPYRGLIDHYLSKTHRDNPGTGCILPTLASDAARSDDPGLRAVFTAVIEEYLVQLERLSSAGGPKNNRRDPGAVLCELVGAVILSRLLDEPEDADQLTRTVAADIVGSELDDA
ncbi:TetR/AcrR family transcriptional regulator [Agrobacterium tumefaciens]|uniref:TetR/AcrR family transcriptional regulator n=1 Tax=Agrobacterium tumefaciens TaxID=358 RepID=UPI001572E5BF|nr:TetR/AcrR family transcriptional regulator [Agrobacterium tumefaciens]MCZ7497339.1 TetR/AcrR family transcriptional regulator [Rhizobium rhizogenes]NTE56553.1 TetR/AcrR family transcriptional regulator [Agrobacterium tumefaciens]NTE74521.1 TetR/AcrR family transcriptional regulator [Agrobacterium tumefaciens]